MIPPAPRAAAAQSELLSVSVNGGLSTNGNLTETQLSQLEGWVLLPSGLRFGRVQFNDLIVALELSEETATGNEVTGPIIAPGFIDVHVHGGGGGDTMDGPEGVRALARYHLTHGTTTIVPTTITNPWEKVLTALAGVEAVIGDGPQLGLPDVLGAHLEGPFISPGRLGAQPPFTLEPTLELVSEALASGVIRVVTLAPELPGAAEAARAFVQAGVRVSLGHTRADYATAERLVAEVESAGGTAGFTHLFNAMGGIEGRAPGVAGAALASGHAFAEVIFDTHHVHEGALKAALAALGDRVLFITDAIRAAGMGEGVTELGGQSVTVSEGVARLADGTLAGSVLTMDQALRNGRAAGLSWAQLARLLSGAPARYLGLDDRGEIAVGKRADLVELSPDLAVLSVRVAGRLAHQVAP